MCSPTSLRTEADLFDSFSRELLRSLSQARSSSRSTNSIIKKELSGWIFNDPKCKSYCVDGSREFLQYPHAQDFVSSMKSFCSNGSGLHNEDIYKNFCDSSTSNDSVRPSPCSSFDGCSSDTFDSDQIDFDYSLKSSSQQHLLQRQMRRPPHGYLCHLCFCKGHFIKDCPEVIYQKYELLGSLNC